MDRKPIVSPAAEEIIRRELSLMGADPDDFDRYMMLAQAKMAESVDPVAASVSGVEAADRVLLEPRPFRIGSRPLAHLWRRDIAGPELRVGLLA